MLFENKIISNTKSIGFLYNVELDIESINKRVQSIPEFCDLSNFLEVEMK